MKIRRRYRRRLSRQGRIHVDVVVVPGHVVRGKQRWLVLRSLVVAKGNLIGSLNTVGVVATRPTLGFFQVSLGIAGSIRFAVDGLVDTRSQ